jgi:hypothetical protein
MTVQGRYTHVYAHESGRWRPMSAQGGRRGVHTALLSARLADAAAAGCDVAVIITQPGSKSQQNAQRHGFDLLYARAVLVKQPWPC